MSDESMWLPTGFQALLALAAWVAIVLLYGLSRSLRGESATAERPSGPVY
jgi:hypothetical protein